MCHAIKVTNNMRPDTRHVSLTLNDSFETVPCYFDVDAITQYLRTFPMHGGRIGSAIFSLIRPREHYWNRTPLMSFGMTGVIETCTFHSCPEIRGCTGMSCTES